MRILKETIVVELGANETVPIPLTVYRLTGMGAHNGNWFVESSKNLEITLSRHALLPPDSPFSKDH